MDHQIQSQQLPNIVGQNPIGYNNGYQTLILVKIDGGKMYNRYDQRLREYDFKGVKATTKYTLTNEQKERLKRFKTDVWRNKYIDSL